MKINVKKIQRKTRKRFFFFFFVLGRHASSATHDSFAISAHSELHTLQAFQTFQHLTDLTIMTRTHCVATSAVHKAANKAKFLECMREKTRLEVEVLSGVEEARLVYLGTLQFFNVFENLVLCVDIRGGYIEFVVGKRGNAIFAYSLNLGHVSLTQKGFGEYGEMKEFIRFVIGESGLVENVKRCDFEVVVGSSGTIQALEKAVFYGYNSNESNGFEVVKRDWRLSKGELRGVVERLCCEGEEESERRERLFKRRSEFIVAGATLLEEIFEALGVKEMEVFGFALAEGVVAEVLSKVYKGCDFSLALNVEEEEEEVLSLSTKKKKKKKPFRVFL